jgi:hypothetical protein
MIDHFAPQRTHPAAWDQMRYADAVRRILTQCRMEIEALGHSPIYGMWPTPGYDEDETIATLVALTPPVATAETWRAVDREAREREAV